MLYTLMHEYAGLGIFRYISFRGAMAVLTGFTLALVMGGPVISWLGRHRIGEDVSKSDSKDLASYSSLAGKQGTPTMGGSFLIASLLLTTLLWCPAGQRACDSRLGPGGRPWGRGFRG